MRLIPRTLDQIQSPIESANLLLRKYQGDRPVLDLSQGAPNYPTAPVIANHVAKVACEPDGSKYTSRAGLDTLRELVAAEISESYAGVVTPDQVLITAGCNQAFCLAVSALADYREEVILPVPYYFNHEMWLRLDRIVPVHLPSSSSFLPDPRAADALITPKTRAIVLVTPGNPTGVTVPPPVIHEFANLANKRGIILILDETYRVFRSLHEPPHELFKRRFWHDNVVSLHSFSKEFAIPGHRVGAAIAHHDLIVEMMKLSDCVSICAPRLGQEAAIAALTSAKDWRDERVLEVRTKQYQFEAIFANRPGGFELCSAGAFYGWVRHGILGDTTGEVVCRLLLDCGVLALPGTIFTPHDDGYLRLSFGNLATRDVDELKARLTEFR